MKKIEVFLSSSKELQEIRKQFEIFINQKNKEWVDKGVFLKLIIWEDFIEAFSSTRLQDEYNKAARNSDIFILLLYNKLGEFANEEFEHALKQFKESNKPLIYTYFQENIPDTKPIDNETESIIEFKNKLDELGHFYSLYKNMEDLKFKINKQLDKLASNGFIDLDSKKEEKKGSSFEATNFEADDIRIKAKQKDKNKARFDNLNARGNIDIDIQQD